MFLSGIHCLISFFFVLIQRNKNQGLTKNACVSSECEISIAIINYFSQSLCFFEMTLMIVTFFNASGIDFGNFLNAHLKSKRLSTNYLTSTAMTVDTV